MLSAVHKVNVPSEAIRMWGGDPEDMEAATTVEALEAMREYAESLLGLAAGRLEAMRPKLAGLGHWTGPGAPGNWSAWHVLDEVHHWLVHYELHSAGGIDRLARQLREKGAAVIAGPGVGTWKGDIAQELEQLAASVLDTFAPLPPASTAPPLRHEVPRRVKSIACILVGGADRVIQVKGVDYPFEDHPQLGPCPVNARGQEKRLGPRHAFWGAVTAWVEQGRRIGEDGRCLWEPPDPFHGMDVVQLGPRTFATRDVAERVLGEIQRRREPSSEPPDEVA